MDIKEKLIEKLKKWIIETDVITLDKDVPVECDEKSTRELRDGSSKEVYKLSFRTEDVIRYDEKGEIGQFGEGMYCSAYYDAEKLELLYIAKGKPGYIEPDGSY